MSRYRYNADLGKEIPVEDEAEREEREEREKKERAELEWKKYQAEREQRAAGAYL